MLQLARKKARRNFQGSADVSRLFWFPKRLYFLLTFLHARRRSSGSISHLVHLFLRSTEFLFDVFARWWLWSMSVHTDECEEGSAKQRCVKELSEAGQMSCDFARFETKLSGCHSRFNGQLESLLITTIGFWGELNDSMQRDLDVREIFLTQSVEVSVESSQDGLMTDDQNIFLPF